MDQYPKIKMRHQISSMLAGPPRRSVAWGQLNSGKCVTSNYVCIRSRKKNHISVRAHCDLPSRSPVNLVDALIYLCLKIQAITMWLLYHFIASGSQ